MWNSGEKGGLISFEYRMAKVSVWWRNMIRWMEDISLPFVQRQFPKLFAQNSKTPRKLWIQDGNLSKNCKSARLAWEELGANLLKIPPRSPDLNPIENVFHLASQSLNRETIARSITKETYEEFSSRVIRTRHRGLHHK